MTACRLYSLHRVFLRFCLSEYGTYRTAHSCADISIHSERNPKRSSRVDDSIEGVLIISVSHSVVNQCLKLFFRIVFFPTIRYVLYAQSKP